MWRQQLFFFLSTSHREYKKMSISCSFLTSHTASVCLSCSFFFSCFLARRVGRFRWIYEGGKCIMGTTTCIKEQCIGPGRGAVGGGGGEGWGGRWGAGRASPWCFPACLSRRRIHDCKRLAMGKVWVAEVQAWVGGAILWTNSLHPNPPHSSSSSSFSEESVWRKDGVQARTRRRGDAKFWTQIVAIVAFFF